MHTYRTNGHTEPKPISQAPEGEGCPRCGGFVYMAEQMLARGRVSFFYFYVLLFVFNFFFCFFSLLMHENAALFAWQFLYLQLSDFLSHLTFTKHF